MFGRRRRRRNAEENQEAGLSSAAGGGDMAGQAMPAAMGAEATLSKIEGHLSKLLVKMEKIERHLSELREIAKRF
jgi:hypothetical protein